MADLNIRNIEPELLRKIKVRVAEEGTTLRNLVIGILEREFLELSPESTETLKKAFPFSDRIEKPVKAKSERKRPKIEQFVGCEHMGDGRTCAACMGEDVYRIIEDAKNLCEHGRDPKTCLECDWFRRQK